MAKVHLLVHVDFIHTRLEMACGREAGPGYDNGEPIVYTNSDDLLRKYSEKWACKRCLAALKKGGE